MLEFSNLSIGAHLDYFFSRKGFDSWRHHGLCNIFSKTQLPPFRLSPNPQRAIISNGWRDDTRCKCTTNIYFIQPFHSLRYIPGVSANDETKNTIDENPLRKFAFNINTTYLSCRILKSSNIWYCVQKLIHSSPNTNGWQAYLKKKKQLKQSWTINLW